jgi:hypothetical protein
METKNKVWYQIQWRRLGHGTWQIDADQNTALFETKQRAIDFMNEGGFDNLETQIVEVY